MTLRHHDNFVAPTLLAAGIDDNDTTLEVASTAGFPDAPFVLALGNDQQGGGELVLCTEVTDGTHFEVERGYDGTTKDSWLQNTLVEHTSAAIDFREAGIARVDTTERNALDDENLWEGRTVFNTDTKHLDVFSGTSWLGVLPVGAVIPYSASTPPEGYLMCNGQAVLRASYPDLNALYAADNYPFGEGDGSTTFNVPDLQGRSPLGVAASGLGDALGETGGALEHTHTGPSHTHGPGTLATESAGAHTHTQGSTSSEGAHTHSVSGTSGSTSIAHTHELGGSTGNSTGHFHNVGNTGSSGSHSHSVGSPTGIVYRETPGTGAVSSTSHTHSTNSTGSHSHSNPDTSGESGHTHPLPSNTGTTSSSTNHSHSFSATSGSSGSHSHTNPTTASSGDHSHAVNAGVTAAAGTGNTGVGTHAFLALNFIVRY